MNEVGLEEFVSACAAEGASAELVRATSKLAVGHAHGAGNAGRARDALLALEDRWYASIRARAPDFTVYDADAYLGELWGCWVIYSRPYLRNITLPQRGIPETGQAVVETLGRVRTVADLGCGCGLTCAALQQLFPGARVFGTNLDGTIQMRIARRLSARYGFTVVPDLGAIPAGVDLVFASEYFEHIPVPVAHLLEVLALLRPRVLLIANAFGARAIGHFPFYQVERKWIPADATSRAFNATLRSNGYEKIPTQLWSSRPAYWRQRVGVPHAP